jgi:hypothetical protein
VEASLLGDLLGVVRNELEARAGVDALEFILYADQGEERRRRDVGD